LIAGRRASIIPQATTWGSGVEERKGGAERRRAQRRELPFGRGAVLSCGGRNHIVGLADVSVTGAYVTTQAPLAEGALCTLAISIPFDHPELRLQALVVRVVEPTKWPQARRRGLALQFEDVDEASLARLRVFVERMMLRR
jgi:hypothetical protein